MKSTFIIKTKKKEKQQIKIVFIKPIKNNEIRELVLFFIRTLSKKVVKEKKKKYIFKFKKVGLGFSYLQIVIDSFIEEQLYKSGIKSRGIYNEKMELLPRPNIKRTHKMKLQKPSIFNKKDMNEIKNENAIQKENSKNSLSKDS